MMGPVLQSRIVGSIALAVLIAIAGVLISPAVPSAPTLLPVSALFLVGLVVVSYHAVVRMRWPVLAVLASAEATGKAAGLEFVRASLPLRR
jgi:hypothetical protein